MKIKFKILLVEFLLVLTSCKANDSDKIIQKIENSFVGSADKYYEPYDGGFEYWKVCKFTYLYRNIDKQVSDFRL